MAYKDVGKIPTGWQMQVKWFKISNSRTSSLYAGCSDVRLYGGTAVGTGWWTVTVQCWCCHHLLMSCSIDCFMCHSLPSSQCSLECWTRSGRHDCDCCVWLTISLTRPSSDMRTTVNWHAVSTSRYSALHQIPRQTELIGTINFAKTHTHTTILRLCGLCLGQSVWAGTRRYISPFSGFSGA